MVVGVHIGEVEGPVVPLEAHTGGVVVAAVGRHHEVGIAHVHGRTVVHETEAQGHPVVGPPFSRDIEGPVVAPLTGSGIGFIERRFLIEIELFKAAPQRIHGTDFDAQRGDRLVGHTHGEGVRQMESAAKIVLRSHTSKGKVAASRAHQTAVTSLTIHLEAHRCTIHEAHGPLIVQLGMQGDIAAKGKAMAIDAGITTHLQSLLKKSRNSFTHLHIGIQHFSSHGEGDLVGELVGDIGRDGAGDELHGLKIQGSGPVIGVLHTKAEAGELADAQPQLVVHLMGEVPGRDGPSLVSAVVVFASALVTLRIHVHAPVHLSDGKVALNLGAGHGGHGSGVEGNGRGVAAAGHKAAAKGHAAGAAFKRGGKAFGLGLLGRNGKREGKKGAHSERALTEHIHRNTPESPRGRDVGAAATTQMRWPQAPRAGARKGCPKKGTICDDYIN